MHSAPAVAVTQVVATLETAAALTSGTIHLRTKGADSKQAAALIGDWTS
jgi:hypothetical protein